MFISQSLLVGIIGYEKSKQLTAERSQALWNHFESRVAAFAEQYDAKRYKQADCTGDILCERQGARHKADCLGKTERFTVYAKALRSVQ
jgi:hypothetical protein